MTSQTDVTVIVLDVDDNRPFIQDLNNPNGTIVQDKGVIELAHAEQVSDFSLLLFESIEKFNFVFLLPLYTCTKRTSSTSQNKSNLDCMKLD